MNANDVPGEVEPSKRKRRLRIAAWTVAIMAAYIIISKLNMAPATEGWVVDAESGEPVEGVIVVAYWGMEKAWAWSVAPAGAIAVFEEVTDKDGYYRIPGWGPRLAEYSVRESADPLIILFKNGYEPRILGNMKVSGSGYNSKDSFFRPSMWDGKTVEIKRFTGTPEERIEGMRRIIPNLEGDYSKQIPLLLNAILEEEKSIPNSAHRKRPFFDNIVRRHLRGG